MYEGVLELPQTVAVLQADPDLGRGLDPFALREAQSLAARSVTVSPGQWSPTSLAPVGGLGVLMVSGMVMRDVVLAETRCTELIADGDVVELRDLWANDRLVPLEVDWTVVAEARLALLDDDFLEAAARWPAVLSALFERAAERSFRLSTHAAICQLGNVDLRLRALMWHLAERWGRVSPDGILVRLSLSHAALGRLVGARRPTVSLALKELAERGEVIRRADGSWLLPGEPPEELRRITSAHPDTPRGIGLLPDSEKKEAVAIGKVFPVSLHDRVEALRDVYRATTTETASLVERARSIRSESARLRDLRSQPHPSSESRR